MNIIRDGQVRFSIPIQITDRYRPRSVSYRYTTGEIPGLTEGDPAWTARVAQQKYFVDTRIHGDQVGFAIPNQIPNRHRPKTSYHSDGADDALDYKGDAVWTARVAQHRHRAVRSRDGQIEFSIPIQIPHRH